MTAPNLRRYDVKYGSAGFNPYGYQAGCAFVSGTFQEALQDPMASPFLCQPDTLGNISCLSDFSGPGICLPPQAFDNKQDYDVRLVDTVRPPCNSTGSSVAFSLVSLSSAARVFRKWCHYRLFGWPYTDVEALTMQKCVGGNWICMTM